jgi:tripartite-type tricarboxylate transporter receptor subunit TctC
MNRRDILKAAAALPLSQAALTALAGNARAQVAWPARNITMIVPFPAGGQADLAARPVALALEKILGKSVIVDNRAGGAGGSVGNAAAARAEPDGYTLLMTLSSLAVLPEADRLFDRPVAYEVSQFAPVARVLADPTLLAVPASAPWKTLQDFVDDAKKRPGEIPYGSSGPYGTLHVAMEMFAASAGIKLLHVPFRGAGPALTALLGNTVQALASAPGTLKAQVEDGKMRVLANWGAERIASFPDLPTFKELGYRDVEFYIWAGLFAQSALPAPIMTRLREAMAQAVKMPEVTKTFETAGSPVAYMDAPEFAKFVADDSARLIAAVKKIGKWGVGLLRGDVWDDPLARTPSAAAQHGLSAALQSIGAPNIHDSSRQYLQAERPSDPVHRGVGDALEGREDRPRRAQRLRQDNAVPDDHRRGVARRGPGLDRSRHHHRLFQPGCRRDGGSQRGRRSDGGRGPGQHRRGRTKGT